MLVEFLFWSVFNCHYSSSPLQVVGVDGGADIVGELDDCPATLMSILNMLIHSYSMRSLGERGFVLCYYFHCHWF